MWSIPERLKCEVLYIKSAIINPLTFTFIAEQCRHYCVYYSWCDRHWITRNRTKSIHVSVKREKSNLWSNLVESPSSNLWAAARIGSLLCWGRIRPDSVQSLLVFCDCCTDIHAMLLFLLSSRHSRSHQQKLIQYHHLHSLCNSRHPHSWVSHVHGTLQ